MVAPTPVTWYSSLSQPPLTRSAKSPSRSVSMSGPVAQPDAAVECHGPDPERHTASAEFPGIPEPDVVATAGIGAYRLLEGEVLLPPGDEQAADGRIGVGAVTEHAVGDAEARLHGNRSGGVPAGADHGLDQLVFSPDQADVERVAGDALGGPRGLGGTFEGGLVLVVPPESREYHVSREQPYHGQGSQDLQCPGHESPSFRAAFRRRFS